MHARLAFRNFTHLTSRTAIAAGLALAIGAVGLSRPAEAGSRWVGPAFAGAVIGGILAHEYHRHHYRKYPRYHRRHAKYRKKYRRRHYYAPQAYYAPYPPAVVFPVPVPVPVPFFVTPRW